MAALQIPSPFGLALLCACIEIQLLPYLPREKYLLDQIRATMSRFLDREAVDSLLEGISDEKARSPQACSRQRKRAALIFESDSGPGSEDDAPQQRAEERKRKRGPMVTTPVRPALHPRVIATQTRVRMREEVGMQQRKKKQQQ